MFLKVEFLIIYLRCLDLDRSSIGRRNAFNFTSLSIQETVKRRKRNGVLFFVLLFIRLHHEAAKSKEKNKKETYTSRFEIFLILCIFYVWLSILITFMSKNYQVYGFIVIVLIFGLLSTITNFFFSLIILTE